MLIVAEAELSGVDVSGCSLLRSRSRSFAMRPRHQPWAVARILTLVKDDADEKQQSPKRSSNENRNDIRGLIVVGAK
jgi:hypothetical protein